MRGKGRQEGGEKGRKDKSRLGGESGGEMRMMGGKNLLKNYYPPRDLRSSKKNLLVVPAFCTNCYGRRAFSVIAPLLWNSLPQHIRDAGSLDIFKRRLKTALFIRAF